MTGLPVQPAVPAHVQTFLAFDFGLKRTGVATGNRMLRSATPQATIKAEGDARFVQVAQRIKEWQRAWKERLIDEMNPDWRDLSKAPTCHPGAGRGPS